LTGNLFAWLNVSIFAHLQEPVAFLPVLSTAVRHTIPEVRVTNKTPGLHHNGNIYPFVASRKKYLFLKRTFDILFSMGILMLVMTWLLPIVALLIRMDSKGPVFFLQKRVGKNGRIFRCIKFRTMHRNEEADEKPACENDERITRTGMFLRMTGIDELPQFINVLGGQMSVVGPRPHMITDCIRFSFVISSYSFRNLVRPGITGWAQVNGHHGKITDYKCIQQRYYWDALYVNKACLWLDMKILAKTCWRMAGNVRREA
jgi:putative colanic acid biosynthesis UDP-glucose lipid carrier transferase